MMGKISLLLAIVCCMYLVQAKVYSNLRFRKPCPERFHDFHNATATFLCIIPTAKECFEACSFVGCHKWAYSTPDVQSYDTMPRDHFRCRCVRRYGLCSHAEADEKYRGYEGSALDAFS
ncbi:hypothetical protein Ciccas_008738 [Cichlidogyrus casuarinus]|uniref:Secreted protein n=1 Tax=Cichlidogyrus casuarinus TaxID=1844966 RepID=A0ABD2PZ18_9PLAT